MGRISLHKLCWFLMGSALVTMVNCGATALFISERFMKTNKVHIHPLVCKIPFYNIDGLRNKAGSIVHFVCLQLQIGEVEEWQEFLVTELGPENVVLGLPWLRSTNPVIDWAKNIIKVKNAPIDSKVRPHKGGNIEQIVVNRMQWCWWWREKVLEDPWNGFGVQQAILISLNLQKRLARPNEKNIQRNSTRILSICQGIL